MNWTEIILGVIGFAGIAMGVWAQIKLKTIESSDKSIDRNHKRKQDYDQRELSLSEQYRRDMREVTNRLEEKNERLEKKCRDLEERLDAIKSGVLTLKMFGTDAPLAMWAKDREGRRTFHNKEYEVMTGYLLTHCAGLTDIEITNNEEMAKAWSHNDDHVLATGAYYMTVEPCAHKNRPEDLFMVFVIKWPTRIQGQIMGTEGVAIRVDKIQETIDGS